MAEMSDDIRTWVVAQIRAAAGAQRYGAETDRELAALALTDEVREEHLAEAERRFETARLFGALADHAPAVWEAMDRAESRIGTPTREDGVDDAELADILGDHYTATEATP